MKFDLTLHSVFSMTSDNALLSTLAHEHHKMYLTIYIYFWGQILIFLCVFNPLMLLLVGLGQFSIGFRF